MRAHHVFKWSRLYRGYARAGGEGLILPYTATRLLHVWAVRLVGKAVWCEVSRFGVFHTVLCMKLLPSS